MMLRTWDLGVVDLNFSAGCRFMRSTGSIRV